MHRFEPQAPGCWPRGRSRSISWTIAPGSWNRQGLFRNVGARRCPRARPAPRWTARSGRASTPAPRVAVGAVVLGVGSGLEVPVGSSLRLSRCTTRSFPRCFRERGTRSERRASKA
jgi:hypothetical protein